MKYWLMKSEPSTFSWKDLLASPDQTTLWEGVRNYQARNFMRDKMQPGDLAFFYHSSCKEPEIMGIVQIVETQCIDPSAFDPESPYFDPKSSPERPRWIAVKVKAHQAFSASLPLSSLKKMPELSQMILLRPGNRLSITPVSADEWAIIQTKTHFHSR